MHRFKKMNVGKAQQDEALPPLERQENLIWISYARPKTDLFDQQKDVFLITMIWSKCLIHLMQKNFGSVIVST